MEATILRSEAKKIIDSGITVDLSFVTADRRRGTGGQFIAVKGWRKVQDSAPIAAPLPSRIHTPKRELARDPRHGVHKTFNICNPRHPSLHIHKVHYRLMVELNGKRIIQ